MNNSSVKELLEQVLEQPINSNIRAKINNYLKQDFKEEVIKKFGLEVRCVSTTGAIKLLSSNADFVYNTYYRDKDFLNKYWNRIDEIRNILIDYLKEVNQIGEAIEVEE